MMGESCVCLRSKEIKFLVYLDHFSKYLKYLRNFENQPKWTKNSNFFASKARRHNSLPSFWAKLGYSWIKIDHIADSVLKLQIKIGVHLKNFELLKLLTPGTYYWLEKEILDSRFFDNLDKFTNSKPPLWTAGVRQRACDAFLCKLLSRQLA